MDGTNVVHFEVVGKDPARLRDYFSQLFGWSFAGPSPVAQEVSAPDEYGFLLRLLEGSACGIDRYFPYSHEPNEALANSAKGPTERISGKLGVLTVRCTT